MTPALVIHVFPQHVGGTRIPSVAVSETPGHWLPDADAFPLGLSADQPPFASLMQPNAPQDVVKLCGQEIYKSLDVVPRFNKTVLRRDSRTPIFVKLEMPVSENLPWEALHHPDGFVALEVNWPLARLAPTSVADNRDATIEPELTYLVVLAASPGQGPAPVHANDEWNALWKVMQASPLRSRLRVHVLTCQYDILKQIENLPEDSVRVTAELLTSAQTILQAVDTLAPNVVHMFCHGDSEHAEPKLLLATVGDFDAGYPAINLGGIEMGMSELAPITRAPSVWLISLNCCQGARASSTGASSLAARLSFEGVPAVVAMRESVDFRLASTFAGEYHGRLLQALAPLLPTGDQARNGNRIDIDDSVWVDAMQPARATLSPSQRHQDPTWTLPVLYLRRGTVHARSQEISASALTLLPQESRSKISEHRSTAATLRSLIRPGQPEMGFKDMADDAERKADSVEREALRLFIAAPGLPPLKLALAKRRCEDLARRLDTAPTPPKP